MAIRRGFLLLVMLSALGGCLHVQLNGSVSDANITVALLRDPDTIVVSTSSFDEDHSIESIGQEKWDSLSANMRMWWLGIFQVNPNPIDENTLYLLTASGGADNDMDRDRKVDSSPTPLTANWRAIMTGEQLLRPGQKLSALTEVAYRWIAPDIGGLSDSELLQRLNDAAAAVVSDIDSNGSSNYDDLVNWTRLFNASSTFKRDISLLDAFTDALISGASEATLDALATDIMEGRAAADYDADYWRQLSAELDKRTFATAEFLYATTPDTDFCIEGSLTTAARDRARENLNQIRTLHKLAPVSYSALYDSDVQEGALIQAASGFLSHFPDTGAPCFTGGGANASATGNLSEALRLQDPAADMVGWVNDSANISQVSSAGHRRWIINPFLAYTSYGQVDGWSVQKVFDFDLEAPVLPEIAVEYVAFPYRTYPYLFFSTNAAEPTPWSFSVIEDRNEVFGNQHAYFTNVGIEITRLSDGTSMAITDQHSDSSGFGVPNFLSWQVPDWEFDTNYQVTISNVAMQSGLVKDFSYPVFIDYADLIDLSEPLEAGDGITGDIISGSLFDGNDEDSYSVQLGGNVTITGDSQFSNQAFFILLYGPDKQLVQAADESFTVNLATGVYTVVISNCGEPGCYSGDKTYTVTFE